MIIGILGKKGVGKDTCADYIVQKYNYNKYSFAKPLKDICKILFGFTNDQLYGNQKEVQDDFWKVTPRIALQYIGTDLLRNQLNTIMPHINQDIWVNVFKANYKKDNIVIADCRFQNEVDTIKEMGGIVIKLNRIMDNLVHDAHISEDIDNIINYDYEIHNDSTLGDLYKKIDNILSL